MKRLIATARTLSITLVLLALSTTAALACEKHLDGHQSSSDTSGEASQR